MGTYKKDIPLKLRLQGNIEEVDPPADLKTIPVSVPAATVLMSSSAPLAFSIATPKAL